MTKISAKFQLPQTTPCSTCYIPFHIFVLVEKHQI